MINKLVEKVSLKFAIIFTVFFGVMLWLIDYSPIGVAGLLKVTDGVSILDYETRYTVDFAYTWLESMGEAGRSFHLLKIMPLDFVYPPSLMLFMFGWISILLKVSTKDGSLIRYFNVLPIIYLLLDYLENIGIISMIINYPARLATICVCTGWITSIKKTVVLFIILLALVLLVVAIFKSIRGAINAKTKG